MNKTLKSMMKKGSFEAYRLGENGCLEILGRESKSTDCYFLFDGNHYFFGNPLVRICSDENDHKNIIMAMTDTKLLIPQGNDDDLYIARNHAANEDLLVIVLYMYADHIFYLVTSGKGSGRVHPVYLPFTEEGYKFCFHAAVEAIASVDPSMAEMLFPYLQKKCKEAKTETTTYEH